MCVLTVCFAVRTATDDYRYIRDFVGRRRELDIRSNACTHDVGKIYDRPESESFDKKKKQARLEQIIESSYMQSYNN